VLPKSSVLLCVSCEQKDSTAKDIYKEMFPPYGGKCLSRKAVHNWFEKFSNDVRISQMMLGADAEMPEATVKRLLCCGFRRTGKAMDKCISVGGRYVEK
jgi:hypothetical protein